VSPGRLWSVGAVLSGLGLPSRHQSMNIQLTDEESRNVAAYHRFHDAVMSRDETVIGAVIENLVAPDATIATPFPTEAGAPETLKRLWAMLLNAFPDLDIRIDDVIAKGDRVVIRDVVTGTNLGEYQGRAPTGRRISYDEIFVLRFLDGQIVQTWGVVDTLAQLRQLGVIAA
jgi:predicted ester cyclase